MNANPQADIFVSLVTVLGSHNIPNVASEIRKTVNLLQKSYMNFELILVDNGVTNEVMTSIRHLLDELPCIRVIRLSRKLDFDTAIFGGLEVATGDFIAVFEIDVDPVNETTALIAQLVGGADIVQGMNTRRDTSLRRRFGRRLFFRSSRYLAGLEVSEMATYLSAFTRRTLNALVSSPAGLKYLRHLLRNIGFEVFEYEYEQLPRIHKRTHPGIIEGIELVTNYSLRPLRVLSGIGFIAALVNLAYAIYVVVVFFSMSVERGWTTTNLQLSIMFFVLFLTLSVMSEYLGRILSELRRGPHYIVSEELLSSRFIADETQRNIA